MNTNLSVRPRLPRWLASITWRSVVLVAVLCVLVAAALNPIFISPFAQVLGRTLFVGISLLLVFTAAGHWQQRWLPRWLMRVFAVVVCAPVATLAAYLIASSGDVAGLMNNWSRISGIFLISISAAAVGVVMSLGALYRERDAQARAEALQFELERETLERQAADARLALLHAQIEPHFLFNSLANVQALVESGSDRAAPVLRQLIAYLRAAMPRLNDADATLESELRLVRAYLDLMQLRMPDRLRFEIDIPPGLAGLRFPTMALLTLVENAVRHGIDPSEEGGRIRLAGGVAEDGETVTLSVADTGVGIAGDAPDGVGLANLRSRLHAFFGADARLELHAVAPHGVRAEIVFRRAQSRP
ncbi:MAG TPA: histidine kinase [Burkholderiaceae bacterium]|nr:histidine kinase [Burkholderiaceae bacterium]